jgi:TetR/AcrR family transcriptional regulator, cholesterol catabolism regulator
MEIRSRILSVATELFMKEGVRRITMDQLATALGMSKRTIYEFFSNKDILLKECIVNHINIQRVAMEELSKNSETALHFYLALLELGIQNMKSQNPQFVNDVRIFYPAIWESTLCANRDYNIEKTSLLLHRGISEGVFRSDINIPIISKLMIEFMTILANSDIFPYHSFPPSVMFENAMLTLIRGVSSAKGLELIDQFYMNSNTEQNLTR